MANEKVKASNTEKVKASNTEKVKASNTEKANFKEIMVQAWKGFVSFLKLVFVTTPVRFCKWIGSLFSNKKTVDSDKQEDNSSSKAAQLLDKAEQDNEQTQDTELAHDHSEDAELEHGRPEGKLPAKETPKTDRTQVVDSVADVAGEAMPKLTKQQQEEVAEITVAAAESVLVEDRPAAPKQDAEKPKAKKAEKPKAEKAKADSDGSKNAKTSKKSRRKNKGRLFPNNKASNDSSPSREEAIAVAAPPKM